MPLAGRFVQAKTMGGATLHAVTPTTTVQLVRVRVGVGINIHSRYTK